MSESNRPEDIDTRFDDELARFSAEAAHRLVHPGEQQDNWQPVKSDNLDASAPLSPREHELVLDRAAGVLDAENLRKENEQKIAELERDARIDKKTGLRTFAVLEDDLPRAVALAMREKRGIGLLMVDGKGMKLVNDNISHMTGDKLITTIAKACKAGSRKSDGVYRGGKASDEFYVMMTMVHEDEQHGEIFLDEKTRELERVFEKFAAEEDELREAQRRGWIGVHVGGSFIDFSHEELGRSSHEFAEKLLRDADKDLHFRKKAERAEAKRRLMAEGKAVPQDERLLADPS